MDFCRYRIEGLLTCRTPLHIGSWERGAGEAAPDRLAGVQWIAGETADAPEPGKKAPMVSAVAMDHQDRPCIPASSLKGALRALAGKFEGHESDVHRLFGTQQEDRAAGGRILFQDAPIDPMQTDRNLKPFLQQTPQAGPRPLYWDPKRLTCVYTGTALSRAFQTVEANKLYFYEVVPPGAVFHIVIRGQGVTTDQVGFLLRLFDEFNAPDSPLTLGAETAHGFGEMDWKPTGVSGLSRPEEVRKWLAGTHCGFDGLPRIPAAEWRSYADKFKKKGPAVLAGALTLDIALHFDGPFMVNDPSQVRDTGKADNKKGEQTEPSHIYLKDEQGRLVLRSHSFHGALRAQAERIIRTISPEKHAEKNACYVETRDKACPPVSSKTEVEANLCLACRLFGGNGWRTPVTSTDFSPDIDGDGDEMDQDFVATDRYTGGSAEHKKFKARYRYGPVLSGKLTVDLNRIEPCHAGVLVLALKDLIQNQIFMGFGRAKGFGAVTGEIRSVTLPASGSEWFQNALKDVVDNERVSDIGQNLNEAQMGVLENLLVKLKEKLNPASEEGK